MSIGRLGEGSGQWAVGSGRLRIDRRFEQEDAKVAERGEGARIWSPPRLFGGLKGSGQGRGWGPGLWGGLQVRDPGVK